MPHFTWVPESNARASQLFQGGLAGFDGLTPEGDVTNICTEKDYALGGLGCQI